MLRSPLRTLALLLAVGAAALVVGAPAGAGEVEEYPPPDCSVAVDDDTPQAGDTIVISGANWDPEGTATVLVGGAEVGTVDVEDDGTWTFEYAIPADAEAGDYEVTAEGCEGGEVLGTTITVAAAPAAEPGAIPRTGSSTTEPLVRTGAVLIAAGGVLLYAVRRRREAAAS